MAKFTNKIDFTRLTPEQKLQILAEMGFTEDPPAEHGRDCLHTRDAAFRCTCVPPATAFRAPSDVKAYMGESLRSRNEFGRRRRDFMNDGNSGDPGMWVTHLEKTAERCNS